MHYFHYKNDHLYCEDVKIQDIVERFGSPCYVYSHRTLTEHFHKIRRAFSPVDPLICYSVKANSNLAICRILLKEGAGLDVVSGGELFRALCAGVDPNKIVFAGVGKTSNEIRQAINSGILFFNVESEQELDRIQSIALHLRKTADVCLRVNVEVDPHTHRYITTARKESKFGLSFDIAKNMLLCQNRFFNVRIRGLHIHIGSQITEARPFVQAVKKVKRFIDDLKKEGICLEYLNIGGGMGINYKEDTAKTAATFAKVLVPLLKETKLKIVLEPGRFIVGSAGILVSRATYIKKTRSKNFIVLDAAMNDLIRPALYEAYHEISLLENRQSHSVKYDIVGPICESGDFLAKDRELPQVHQGDFLSIMCAGAYGFSMSSNYNSRLRAAEILVKGNSFYLIREREHYYDLIDKEIIPKFLRDRLRKRLSGRLKRRLKRK